MPIFMLREYNKDAARDVANYLSDVRIEVEGRTLGSAPSVS
jgi:hypothetical protein